MTLFYRKIAAIDSLFWSGQRSYNEGNTAAVRC